jgi:hypothetical protein
VTLVFEIKLEAFPAVFSHLRRISYNGQRSTQSQDLFGKPGELVAFFRCNLQQLVAELRVVHTLSVVRPLRRAAGGCTMVEAQAFKQALAVLSRLGF